MREIICDVGSIGFGVQSIGMALMAGMDMIPRPDIYCYSELPDSKRTLEYRHYITPLLNRLGVDVRILKTADLYEHIMSWPVADRVSMIPVWFMGADGRRQPLNRQCTADYKVDIVARDIRAYLDVKRLKRNSVRVWQGISLDEIKRTKKKGYSLFPDNFRVNHLPFIGHYANITYPQFAWRSYTREKIIDEIFIANSYRVPHKSSCFFCPFHDIEEWYDLFINDPDGWEMACKLDDSIRDYNTPTGVLESGPFYLYSGLIPLREIDFDKERANVKTDQLVLGCESGFCML